MQAFIGFLCALVVSSAIAGIPAPAAERTTDCQHGTCSEWVYVGTRAEGSGQGIWAAQLDAGTGQIAGLRLVAEVSHATWLQAHPRPPVLYAVNESGGPSGGASSVYSFAVDRDSGNLRLLNQSGSGGGGAAHLYVDPISDTVFVANYVSGSVAALPILSDGRLGAATSVQQQSGAGPNQRQRSSHAHSVLLDPSRRFLLSADLGADRIFVYRFNPSSHGLTPNDPPSTVVAPGSGPRHMAFHPNGRLLMLINELTAELQTYYWDVRRGRLQLLKTASTLSPDFKGTPSAAEIAISPDGRFVYASNRSEDTLLVYSLNTRNGALSLVQRILSEGHLPWAMGFDLSGRWLLVTNTDSNSVSVFHVDTATGRLSGTHSTLTVPSPSSVAFFPSGNQPFVAAPK